MFIKKKHYEELIKAHTDLVTEQMRSINAKDEIITELRKQISDLNGRIEAHRKRALAIKEANVKSKTHKPSRTPVQRKPANPVQTKAATAAPDPVRHEDHDPYPEE